MRIDRQLHSNHLFGPLQPAVEISAAAGDDDRLLLRGSTACPRLQRRGFVHATLTSYNLGRWLDLTLLVCSERAEQLHFGSAIRLALLLSRIHARLHLFGRRREHSWIERLCCGRFGCLRCQIHSRLLLNGLSRGVDELLHGGQARLTGHLSLHFGRLLCIQICRLLLATLQSLVRFFINIAISTR